MFNTRSLDLLADDLLQADFLPAPLGQEGMGAGQHLHPFLNGVRIANRLIRTAQADDAGDHGQDVS